jgi:S1-C subfamily serine protease
MTYLWASDYKCSCGCGVDTVIVALKDGRNYPGRVVGSDSLSDLAVVKINCKQSTDGSLRQFKYLSARIARHYDRQSISI